MRILFLGDIVGSPGINAVRAAVPGFARAEQLDLVIANAENAAGGSGLTPRLYRRLRESGIGLFTLGDHIYKKSDIIETLLSLDPRICKPANYPPDAPGREFALTETADGIPVAAFTVLGRTYMRPVDCPFRAADRVLKQLDGIAKVIIVDIHAEATADKYLMLHHLKGRVSAVLGTHTHVQTADEQVFRPGTAFICDVGMTGPHDSILGRRIDRVLETAITFVPTMFDVAEGDVRICGVIVDIDPATGRASDIHRVKLDEKAIATLSGAGP